MLATDRQARQRRSRMSVLELERTAPRREGGDSAAKAWLRALAATAPIAAHPQRTLPAVIEELADSFGDAPALLSERETLTYRELAARANRYARWALELGVAHGRHGLPADAEPARISGDLARRDADRRHRRAPQYQPRRRRARPLHQYRRAQAHHRGGGARRAPSRARAPRHRPSSRASGCTALRARRARARDARLPAHRPRHRAPVGRAAERRRAAAGHHRGPGALHLHVGHHRAAQGRQCQPSPPHDVEPLVRRHDGYAPERPHVRLPADVSQRRRRRGDRRGAGQRRLGADPREVLRAAVLGRRHAASTARCSNISASSAATWCTRRRIRARAAASAAGSPAATACGPTCGTRSRTASGSRRFSNSTPRPKATSRSTTAKASPAPSAASRRSWRTACRPR